jgi:glucose/arabinose dehydrogenase
LGIPSASIRGIPAKPNMTDLQADQTVERNYVMLKTNILIPTCLIALWTALPGSAQPLADPIPAPIPASEIKVKLTPVVTGLTAPLELRTVEGKSDRAYILDQTGFILVMVKGEVLSQPLLDISAVLAQLNPAFPGAPTGINPGFDERGLLSVAFHPDFNRKHSQGYLKFYTLNSVPVTKVADFPMPPFPAGAEPNCQTVIAERQVLLNNHDVADPGYYRELLRLDKPQFNHNGGSLHFGPDGLLYASFGDGGAADDVGDGHIPVTGNGQSLTTILGKVIRISPLHPSLTSSGDGIASANGQYRIPADNPFVGQAGKVGEIYAYGFRNPYRFNFDGARLILGDVGQNNIEEVDIVTKGGNYGWNKKEGSFLFDPATGDVFTDTSPDPSLIDPVVEYDHFEATENAVTRIAVIGGFVYRDTKIKDLRGQYVFGELNGNLFVADLEAGEMEELSPDVGMFIKGFGQDAQGQLYVVGSTNLGPSGDGGQILRIDRPDKE